MTWAYETEADGTVLELIRQAFDCARTGQVSGSLQRACLAFVAEHPRPFGEVVKAERLPLHRGQLPRITGLVGDLETVEAAMEPLGRARGDCPGAMATLTTDGGTVTLDVDLARDMLGAVRRDVRNELHRIGVQT